MQWSKLIWFFVFLLLLNYFYVSLWSKPGTPAIDIAYTRFKNEIQNDNIALITLEDLKITGAFKQPIKVEEKDQSREYVRFQTYAPVIEDPTLMGLLESHNVIVEARPGREKSWFWILIVNVLPLILFIFLWVYLARRMQDTTGKGIFDISKSKARLYTKEYPKITFEDVADMESAKRDIREIVDYLKNPGKFEKLGCQPPKGVLLIGPPGTGKTLLAKAVAGEADVPFYNISGSEFVEMFVGVGASRVRDLFRNAMSTAPSIIFIDEIDAVGRSRGAGLGGGHDEREQTLNQLLAEMDGFDPRDRVVIVAATNRPDVLDPALLRPGRFDRHIVIDRPERKGREEILHVHTRKVPLAPDVDLSVVARGTPGFSGADLKNLVNEAAIVATRKNREQVLLEDFEEAKDKIIMGAEREMILNAEEKQTVAYHEGGHALLAYLLPNTDPIHKITIIPRGMSLGATHLISSEEKYNLSKSELLSRIVVLMGGRAAELLIRGEESTGAQSDFKEATHIVRKMVSLWGMSGALGPLSYESGEEHVFLGKEIATEKKFSEATAAKIDSEMKQIVSACFERAQELLTRHRKGLDRLAEALLEEEVLTMEQASKILEEVGVKTRSEIAELRWEKAA